MPKRKRRSDPEEMPKCGYSYYFDTKAFGYAPHSSVADFLREVSDMMEAAADTERFYITDGKEWMDFVCVDGYPVHTEIYADYRLTTMLRNIESRFVTIASDFASPADMTDEAIFSSTHNAFIGICYPEQIRTVDHLSSNSERLVYLEDHKIRVPEPDFWDNRDTLYPHLVFVNVDEDFVRLHADYYKTTFKKLEEYCSLDWKTGNFRLLHFKSNCDPSASEEGETVDTNPALRNRRIFDIPGYGSKYCPLHLKRGSRIRTHLWHTDGERRLYVVYCGPHLPTANDPK